jgi:hypothetical protein
LRIFTDVPKPSCCCVNKCTKAAWELKLAVLKSPENLCTLVRRLYENHVSLPCSFRKPVCSPHAALEKQINTAAKGSEKSWIILYLIARSDIKIYN